MSKGSGFGTLPYGPSSFGARKSRVTIPTDATQATAAAGRQRGDGSRPSGKTKASASGQRKSTGHSNATSVAHAPSVESGCPWSASPATASPVITTATDSGPASRIHAIRFPGRRSATNRPTEEGTRTATRRPASPAGGTERSAPCDAATTLTTMPATAAASVAAAIAEAVHRSVRDIAPILPDRVPPDHRASAERRGALRLVDAPAPR
jgi:hypothetical protein